MRIVRKVASKTKAKVISIIRDWQNISELNKILQNYAVSAKPVKESSLFRHVSDEYWFWLYTSGYRRSSALRQLLPSMPEENLQLQFTGASGEQTLKQAFSAYKLFKAIAKKYGKEVSEGDKILDFGCGWGRITRFFLKDVQASNLYGIDCDSEIIDACRASNLRGSFEVINPHPPTGFSENMFDLIYSYSVFSHLSEDIHKEWLREFQRVLKPGGLLIATTRPQEFILHCAEVRRTTDIPFYSAGAAVSFLDENQSLTDYNEGKYCFSATGGGGIRDSSFYGETCIPRAYVEREWTKYFSVVDFIDYQEHKSSDQNVIIAQK